MSETSRDPLRDPALGRALREAEGEPPFDQVDWEGLRARIAASAELPLARLRHEDAAPPAPAVHAPAAAPRLRFRRPLVPIAAAAGIAAAALFGALRFGPAGDPVPAADPAREALVDEIVDAFAAADGAAVFRVVNRVIEGGHEPRRFAGWGGLLRAGRARRHRGSLQGWPASATEGVPAWGLAAAHGARQGPAASWRPHSTPCTTFGARCRSGRVGAGWRGAPPWRRRVRTGPPPPCGTASRLRASWPGRPAWERAPG